MLRVYGTRFVNADFSGSPVAHQSFYLDRNTWVKAFRTWFVLYGSPSFTSLGLQIWDSRSGSPILLKHTATNSFAPGDLLTTHPYGLKEVYFEFANPIWLRKDTVYHFIPWITGAAFTPSSHVAWVKGFPDPNTSHSIDVNIVNMGTLPWYLAAIGDDA